MMEKNPNYPLKVHYCKWCKVPSEYCYLLSENLEKCKEWLLKERKPELIALFEEIYGEKPAVEASADAANPTGEETGDKEEEKEGEK
jgi:hypothetical protein